MEQAPGHLKPAGRIFVFFGSSGDVDYPVEADRT
jgi:hypothetical protein